MTPLSIDRGALETFAGAIFRYATDGNFISLRSFLDMRDGPPFNIRSVKLNGGGLPSISLQAALEATRAAKHSEPVVFCPPLATFRTEQSAAEQNLAEAFALSVECDAEPARAREKLEALLGPATVVVASGGEWVDPATGESEPKLHLHWRLSEPATGPDLDKLKIARRLAASLVGADHSNIPIVHPIRWPGSVHRKGSPVLARIVQHNDGAELELDDALERLNEARPIATGSGRNSDHSSPSKEGRTDDRVTADLVRGVLTGEQLHPNLTPLAARMVGAGMHPGAAVNMLRGIMESSQAPRDDRWRSRYEDIPRAVSTAEAKFKPAGAHGYVPASSEKETSFEVTGFSGEIPQPRPWAYGDFLMEGAVTGIAAPPGVGKTTFSFQIATAFALDLPFGRWTPRPGGGGKVWLYNGEEPKEELDRRFLAACYEMGVDPARTARRFNYNSGLTRALSLGSPDERGVFLRSSDLDAIKATISENGFKLFILDPLAEFHSVKENDTEAFGRVGAAAREIATDCGCSVLLFHHTPKSANGDTAAGDMNSLRGGGALAGVARFIHTLFSMTERDAERLGVPLKERPSYVRWDDAKASMGPIEGGATWWRKIGVPLDNASGVRPADEVGVLRIAEIERAEIDPVKLAEAARATADLELQRLAREIIRVCVANGHTAPETPIALAKVCEAINHEVAGMKTSKARGLVTSRMAGGYEIDGARIVVAHDYRGSVQVTRLHVEGANHAD